VVGLGRKLAGGVTALSAGTLSFLVEVPPAAADEFYDRSVGFDHTFTAEGGQSVTCQVSGGSALFRPTGREEFFGNAFTSTFTPSDEDRCRGFVVVDLTYRDGNGTQRNPGSSAFGDEVGIRVDNVGADCVAQHTVFYLDCVADCFVQFTTAPK